MAKRTSAKRIKRRLMVKYGTGQPDKTAFTMNLSETGAFLRTNNVVRPGTTIQVEIQFPDRTFSLWARVIWAKKVPPQLAHTLLCGMGVVFVNPGDEWNEYFDHWQQDKG